MRHARGKRAAWAGTGLLAVTLLFGSVVQAGPAEAVTVAMNPSTTLGYGADIFITTAWGDFGPYKVNIQCHITGCPNYVVASTWNDGEALHARASVCAGLVRTSVAQVWENAGAGAMGTASTTTTWRPGC